MCDKILSEPAIKNEPKEIYSILQKGHKIKTKYSNGDYSILSNVILHELCSFNFSLIRKAKFVDKVINSLFKNLNIKTNVVWRIVKMTEKR